MSFKSWPLAALAGLSLLLAACGQQAVAEPTTAPAEPTAAPAAHAIHWTYEGEEGPEHWGALDASYATCSSGQSQSPIDISQTSAQGLDNIAFHYQPSEVMILNNGHTVQVNYEAGSYIEVDGQRYDVVQYHYHTPSEHTIDGKSFPAELHIVHSNDKKELAVVGILIEEGAENAAYAPLVSHLPANESPATDAQIKINAADLLPSVQTTDRYMGSLTTPPCTEGVHWFVMNNPVQASAEQITALQSIFGHNNRPVQALNARELLQDNTP